jgi:UDP-N-acetylglucosamine pyrophosphorylase
MEHLQLGDNIKYKSNLEKIKYLKKRADELNLEYHENIEKLKFYDKDVEYMTRKIGNLDAKLENMKLNFK